MALCLRFFDDRTKGFSADFSKVVTSHARIRTIRCLFAFPTRYKSYWSCMRTTIQYSLREQKPKSKPYQHGSQTRRLQGGQD